MPINDDERSSRFSNPFVFERPWSQNSHRPSNALKDGDHIPAILLFPHHRHSRMW